MKLILAHYLRTLRERDEFDRLLPNLLLSMGYVPLSKPQTGVRQYGVDLSVIGKSDADGVEELLLFVIKQGDIGRREWDSGPTSVRPTLNDIVDVYLTRNIPSEYSGTRKVIILATTGDLKQDVEVNWDSYKDRYLSVCNFAFWSGDRVASLVDKYMLNEHVFASDDQIDIRKAIALAPDKDYDFIDLQRLLLRQLGLDKSGNVHSTLTAKNLLKSLRRVHLASQLCANQAEIGNNYIQAIWICERALLLSWHRVYILSDDELEIVLPGIVDLLQSYLKVSWDYFNIINGRFGVKDGFAAYSADSEICSLILFENIGLIALVGLAAYLFPDIDGEITADLKNTADAVAECLSLLIVNNSSSSSPRLDSHIVDILLALMLLYTTGHNEACRKWLHNLIIRLDYCFKRCWKFPVSSDSIDDLISLETELEDIDARKELMKMSWCLPTLAAWSALLNLDDLYTVLSSGSRDHYFYVCGQLWHQNSDWQSHWYFSQTRNFGETEAPFVLPNTAEELRQQIKLFLSLQDYQWNTTSRAHKVGLSILDYIACRHYRRPVPAFAWYNLLTSNHPDVDQDMTN